MAVQRVCDGGGGCPIKHDTPAPKPAATCMVCGRPCRTSYGMHKACLLG